MSSATAAKYFLINQTIQNNIKGTSKNFPCDNYVIPLLEIWIWGTPSRFWILTELIYISTLWFFLIRLQSNHPHNLFYGKDEKRIESELHLSFEFTRSVSFSILAYPKNPAWVPPGNNKNRVYYMHPTLPWDIYYSIFHVY